MNCTSYVDIFHGCGGINLPKPEGVAATWYPIKAISGNTNPAACLPFGKYSVGPYSTGYSSGYWINAVNTSPQLNLLMDHLKLKGFSHFHHSGTGYVGFFYNYAVTTPYYGEQQDFYEIREEGGKPGYYTVTLNETDIRCELTAGQWAAYHRYSFDRPQGRIAIDFSNDGVYKHKPVPDCAAEVSVVNRNSHTLLASAILQGLRLHFAVTFEGDGALDENHVFCLKDPGTVVVKISVSGQDAQDALAENRKASASFDETAAQADAAWEAALGRIQVNCTDQTELALFYSNLYHTLVKPCIWESGSFLWKDGFMAVDFTTMWDIYKTQLPMIFTLYPEVSEKIVASLARLGNTTGRLPVAFLMSNSLDVESGQARMLMEYTFYDAWKRGVEADWEAVLDAIEKDIASNDYPLFEETGFAHRYTYTLDMAEISNGLAELADAYGRTALAARFRSNTEKWKTTFDPATGLMAESPNYYEGNNWNYSFRPLVHHQERIDLCGGVENYVNLLDRFFGYTHPEDTSARFEGFNNETDMEAPYAYHYAGRMDRLCEILDLADKYIFREKEVGTGRGGIPGNNDSGGLSACYLWNCLGLFPVSGQDLMLLSRPKFAQATLFLASGKALTIRRSGTGTCPKAAAFNGESLADFRLPASRLMAGGELTFEF